MTKKNEEKIVKKKKTNEKRKEDKKENMDEQKKRKDEKPDRLCKTTTLADPGGQAPPAPQKGQTSWRLHQIGFRPC